MLQKRFLMNSANFFPNGGRLKNLSCKILKCWNVTRYLFGILHTSSAMKTSKNVVKVGCCLKLRRRAQLKIFLQLIYQEVSNYSRYCQPQSLLKVLKGDKKLVFQKILATESVNLFFKLKKGYNVSCVKKIIFC